MDNILMSLRMQGMRTALASVVSILFLSFFLTACGGGSGPDDKGELSVTSMNVNSVTAGNVYILNTTKAIQAPDSAVEQLCQQPDALLCEDFEWSSDPAFKATNSDWLLKGWQFSGNGDSGNICNITGVGDSLCALKFVQKPALNNLKDKKQTATYIFSEYGAGVSQIAVSWESQWSANWQWNTNALPFIAIESLDSNTLLRTLVAVEIDAEGLLQLNIKDEYSCGIGDNIIKTDSDKISQGELVLARWHLFHLVLTADNFANTLFVQLSLNRNVLIAATLDTSCLAASGKSIEINSISFMLNSRDDESNVLQSMMIDNILLGF